VGKLFYEVFFAIRGCFKVNGLIKIPRILKLRKTIDKMINKHYCGDVIRESYK
jgi:hypothetical protein